jgi:hypothetical protein
MCYYMVCALALITSQVAIRDMSFVTKGIADVRIGTHTYAAAQQAACKFNLLQFRVQLASNWFLCNSYCSVLKMELLMQTFV